MIGSGFTVTAVDFATWREAYLKRLADRQASLDALPRLRGGKATDRRTGVAAVCARHLDAPIQRAVTPPVKGDRHEPGWSCTVCLKVLARRHVVRKEIAALQRWGEAMKGWADVRVALVAVPDPSNETKQDE